MAIEGVDESRRQQLSALADGELRLPEAAVVCSAWGQDAGLRADWHAWHLIGDVLRSEDLASDPARDRRFCAAVGTLLRREPVVLAPSAAPEHSTARPVDRRMRPGRWGMVGAIAAGVVLAVGTLVVVRPGDPPAPERFARADGAATVVSDSAAAALPVAAVAQQVAIVADSKIIRDAQLERYLEAHQQFAGSSALGVPSAFLRSATIDSAAR